MKKTQTNSLFLKLILLGFVGLFISVKCLGQDLTHNDKVAATIKVWGFLKYYHPQVAGGKWDWDQQFIEAMSHLDTVQTKEELSALYLQWIEGLGEVKPCRKCKKESRKEYLNKNFNLSWLEDTTLFTSGLSDRLKYIELNRNQRDNFYVTEHKDLKTVRATNEKQYKEQEWTNENVRLLLFSRYWNLIEYFYPYKYMTDQPWDEVLEEMIPEFVACQSELEFETTLYKAVCKLRDSHAYIKAPTVIDRFFGKYSLPVRLAHVEDQVIVTSAFHDSLAAKEGLQYGDIITKVNGKPVRELYDETKAYISASNESQRWFRFVHYFLMKGKEEQVTVEYIRDNEVPQIKTVNRYPFKSFDYDFNAGKEKWKIIDENVGYVDMNVLTRQEVPAMMEDLMNTKAIVLDLRGYPKGTMQKIAAYMNPKPNNSYARYCLPDYSYPGKFYWVKEMKVYQERGEKYQGKIIGLVNERTQSQAETSAMVIRALENGMLIGSQTSGADGNIAAFNLFKEYPVIFTGMGWYYPNEQPVQRIGIVPDIEVRPSLKGVLDHRDEVLEKALEVLNTSSL